MFCRKYGLTFHDLVRRGLYIPQEIMDLAAGFGCTDEVCAAGDADHGVVRADDGPKHSSCSMTDAALAGTAVAAPAEAAASTAAAAATTASDTTMRVASPLNAGSPAARNPRRPSYGTLEGALRGAPCQQRTQPCDARGVFAWRTTTVPVPPEASDCKEMARSAPHPRLASPEHHASLQDHHHLWATWVRQSISRPTLYPRPPRAAQPAPSDQH